MKSGGEVKLTPPKEKLPSKNPALLGLSKVARFHIEAHTFLYQKVRH